MKTISFLITLLFASNCYGKDLAFKILNENTKRLFLKYHNIERSKNNLPQVTWDDDLAKSAKILANKYSKYCVIDSRDSGASQYWGARIPTIKKVISNWIEEDQPDILWRKSKKIGCAYSMCRDPGSFATSTIFVCKYLPRELSDENLYLDLYREYNYE